MFKDACATREEPEPHNGRDTPEFVPPNDDTRAPIPAREAARFRTCLWLAIAADIRRRQQAKQTLETTLVGIKSAEIVEAKMESRSAFVTVKFVTEQINVTRDAAGIPTAFVAEAGTDQARWTLPSQAPPGTVEVEVALLLPPDLVPPEMAIGVSPDTRLTRGDLAFRLAGPGEECW